MPPHYPLAIDEARFQGDGVAVVIAESRALAKDAAELVEVDYEPLGSVANVEKALEEGAPLVHSDLGTNECYVWKLDSGEVQAAIDAADVVVTRRYFQPRLIPNAIEPRAVLAQAGPTGELTVWSATQVPHILRFALQLVVGVPESKIRVIAPDVGGGFGSKLNVYAEEALAVALARRLGRPVKWTEERSENYVATIHGRDVVHELTFAATKDGRITAVKSEATCAMGAYLQLVTPGIPLLGAWIYNGPYDIPNYSRHLHRRLHEHDADRRVPRSRPARGDLRHRANDGRAGRRARHGPARASAQELHLRVPGPDRVGPHHRLGRLPRVARQARRDARPGRFREGAGGQAEERRRKAARHRLLDVQRDVRAGAVAHPRRHPVCRRRLGQRHDPLPAARLGAGRDRDVAARAGPRDVVGADRRRPARRRRGRRRGPARRHRRLAARDGHVRKPIALRRGRRARARERQDRRQGARDRRPPARGLRRRPRVRRTARSASRDRPIAR